MKIYLLDNTSINYIKNSRNQKEKYSELQLQKDTVRGNSKKKNQIKIKRKDKLNNSQRNAPSIYYFFG